MPAEACLISPPRYGNARSQPLGSVTDPRATLGRKHVHVFNEEGNLV